jgi:hypothetical protein
LLFVVLQLQILEEQMPSEGVLKNLSEYYAFGVEVVVKNEACLPQNDMSDLRPAVGVWRTWRGQRPGEKRRPRAGQLCGTY